MLEEYQVNIMENSEKTRLLLTEHSQRYPQLQVRDIFKFLYQSAFGCEHAVSSPEAAIARIAEEYRTVRGGGATVEPLDGGFSRVPLSYLDGGLAAETLGKLFVLSAQKRADGEVALLRKLACAKEFADEGLLPFSSEEFKAAAEQWETAGFAAVRHSDVFRETYRPSYRVIANEYLPFLSLFAELDTRLAKGRVTLAVEGGSASGKTTLGELLTDLYGCTVFHMDDFFLRPEQRTPERYAEIGGNVDRERLLTEVLQPLQNGETINYRKFDCSTMSVGEGQTVVPEKLTVVEGAYAMHPQLAEYYDLSVFLDIDPALQRTRIQKRNPSLAHRFFDEWIPLETRYFSQTQASDRCTLTIKIEE